jgi:hypothetical protein
MDKLPDAVRYLQSGKSMGKVVVIVRETWYMPTAPTYDARTVELVGPQTITVN